jgi:hypothetical protein
VINIFGEVPGSKLIHLGDALAAVFHDKFETAFVQLFQQSQDCAQDVLIAAILRSVFALARVPLGRCLLLLRVVVGYLGEFARNRRHASVRFQRKLGELILNLLERRCRRRGAHLSERVQLVL